MIDIPLYITSPFEKEKVAKENTHWDDLYPLYITSTFEKEMVAKENMHWDDLYPLYITSTFEKEMVAKENMHLDYLYSEALCHAYFLVTSFCSSLLGEACKIQGQRPW